MNPELNKDISSRTIDYFQRWIKRGRKPDDPLRRRIIELNLGLAGKQARVESQKTRVPREDLYNTGVIGLARAVDKFHPNKGKFSVFATSFITGKIKQHLRDKEGVLVKTPRSTYDEISTLPSKVTKYNKAHKSHVDQGEMAQLRGYSDEKYQEMVFSTKASSVSPIDAAENFELTAPEKPSQDEVLLAELRRAIEYHSAQLGEDGKYLREFYHPDYEGLTIEDIAKRHRVKKHLVEKGIERGLSHIRGAIAL